MPNEQSVIARRDGRAGRILLNRPRALNALDLEMIRALTLALTEWHDDPHVHVIVIEGAGDRAFCAGGDIRALRDAQLNGDRPAADAFFSEEYALNRMIATYPKPYVALIDGICMGGGIGVSVHAPYRVATEHAMFAMPETAIGFFPDIGATFFLPRLPGRIGTYLGLTGARVQGADAVHAGLATQFCPRARLAALAQALTEDGAGALAEFAAPLPAFSLAKQRAALDDCFGADTVPQIVQRLEAYAGDTDAKDTDARDTEMPAGRRCHRLGKTHAGDAAHGLPVSLVLDAEGAAARRRPDAAARAGRRVRADPHDDAAPRLCRGRARDGGGQGSPAALATGADRGRRSRRDCRAVRIVPVSWHSNS